MRGVFQSREGRRWRKSARSEGFKEGEFWIVASKN